MTSILKTALEDIKKLDESLDPEDWASDESMLSITGRVIAALKEAIKNQGEPVGWQQATHANAPKYGERVIVLTTDADGDPIPEFAHYNGELGFLGIGGKRIKPVSYWMPSPTAPKGEQP